MAVGVALSAVGAADALAHGPCRCLPPTAVPGEAVLITNVFKAVWNPTRADIFYEQPDLVAAHVTGTPRIVLLERDRKLARRRARLVVPDVPAGRYLVLWYDGTEGGSHYTWDYVMVRPRSHAGAAPRPAATTAADASSRQSDGFPAVPVVVGVVGLAGVGSLVAVRVRRIRRGRM